jgi:RNA polymerase sigma factor (sigma-70 family)
MTDISTIVKKCIAQDRASQYLLYKHLAPKLKVVCLRYVRSKDAVDDYMQEIFIKIFQNIKEYRGDGSLEGWARRIAVNYIIREYQKKNVLKESSDLESASQITISDIDINSEINHRELLAMINYLPDSQRIIFNLFVIEGYSHKEISEMLDIPEGTSKSKLSRAKDTLVEISRKLNQIYAKVS